MRDEGGVLASSMLIGHPITYVITVEQTQLTQRNLSTDLRASPAYFHFPCWDWTRFQGTELLRSKTRALQNAVSQAHGVNDLQSCSRCSWSFTLQVLLQNRRILFQQSAFQPQHTTKLSPRITLQGQKGETL